MSDIINLEIAINALREISELPHPTWCKSRQGFACGCSVHFARNALAAINKNEATEMEAERLAILRQDL